MASLILRGIIRLGGDGGIGSGAKQTVAGLFDFCLDCCRSVIRAKHKHFRQMILPPKASLDCVLAYVVTGSFAGGWEQTRAGLTDLGYILKQRTSAEPAEPLGVDPAQDDLAFALLYWPIDAPDGYVTRSDKATVSFMRSGGTLVLDVRDGNPAGSCRPASRSWAEPDLPVCVLFLKDHVLTSRSIYWQVSGALVRRISLWGRQPKIAS